jgi:hypothetical protein
VIGTTRSRVSFFMNRFRKLGFIEYNGRIRVYKSLLNVVLQDQLPRHNAERTSPRDGAVLLQLRGEEYEHNLVNAVGSLPNYPRPTWTDESLYPALRL